MKIIVRLIWKQRIFSRHTQILTQIAILIKRTVFLNFIISNNFGGQEPPKDIPQFGVLGPQGWVAEEWMNYQYL